MTQTEPMSDAAQGQTNGAANRILAIGSDEPFVAGVRTTMPQAGVSATVMRIDSGAGIAWWPA